jgi:predicted TIM-barrel fold metal-dependent hydrolase
LFSAGKDTAGLNFRKRIENFDWQDWQGPWDPVARLKDMDLDGVQTEVLYPSMARNLYGLDDAPLQTACLRAYNDWLHEYCSHSPSRLIPLSVLSVLDIDWSIQELQRCAKLGFKGAMLPSGLPEDQTYASPIFDPLWQTAEDLALPISFHENTVQGRDRGTAPRFGNRSTLERGRWRIRAFMEPQKTLVDLIFGLVLERFPRLHFVFAEYELCWVGIILMTDRQAGRSQSLTSSDKIMSNLPSEYMKRQVHITFLHDRIGILGIQVFGADNYMWSSDYPHPVSTWPKSQQSVETVLDGVPDGTRRKLVWDNGARLYGLL